MWLLLVTALQHKMGLVASSLKDLKRHHNNLKPLLTLLYSEGGRDANGRVGVVFLMNDLHSSLLTHDRVVASNLRLH